MAMMLQQPVEGTVEDHDHIPGVVEFLNKTYITMMEFSSFSKYPTDYAFIKTIPSAITKRDIVYVFLIALAITILRYLISRFILVDIARWFQLRESDRSKFVECVWKGTVFLLLWLYSLWVVVLSENHNFYQYTCRIWNNYHLEDNYFERRDLPFDIKVLYWSQIGWYIHSVYATLFMDKQKKDSFAMLLHHALAIGLLLLSFAVRYYELGAIIVLLHDINDVIMELTKPHVYLKHRGGRYHAWHDYIATAGFLVFTAVWVYTRLYLYPLKVLHATNWCVYIYHVNKNPVFWLTVQIMLWPLLFMHIYWFGFIMQLFFRVATGRMSELDDNRDLDENGVEVSNKHPHSS